MVDGQNGTQDSPESADQRARSGSRDPLGRWLPGVVPDVGRQWPKGKSGNPGGRPRSESGVNIRDACRLIVLDPDYREALWERLRNGQAPHIESRIWDLAFGRAIETVEHQGEARPIFNFVLPGHRTDPLEVEAEVIDQPERKLPAMPGPMAEVGFTLEDLEEPRT